ncbi:GNAT family N-acetyltransferase [Mycobacterium vicinigordonae]|uniref:GNAT family N-acetyltransferase n=1 Tax=Mycobacterium vicinigordonae TaxID=1719132 RepID=A0A7D6E364_9MYCO|nr:GNAT family N-acetyltransferase [Mycobacterium vicinigordonae]
MYPNADECLSRRRHGELRTLCDQGHGAWFGAFRDDHMCAGLGVFSDGLGAGRFQHVETHPDCRRRGLVRALLTEAAHHAATPMGVETLVIVADPDYFAADLYRSVGFVDAGTQRIWQRPP